MRFLTRTSFFIILAAAVSTNLPAQRGGTLGHASAPASRGTSVTGARSFPVSRGYPAPLGLQAPAAGYTGIRPGALRSRGTYGHNYSRFSSSYFAAPYYYPFLDYGSVQNDAFGYDPPVDPNAEAAIMAQYALGEQIQRLSAAVDQLQSAQQAQAPAYSRPQDPAPPQAPVTLILRTGQQIEVQNYAVMNQTFWDFTNQPARKIPIANIDIAASTKATEARGGEFPSIDAGAQNVK